MTAFGYDTPPTRYCLHDFAVKTHKVGTQLLCSQCAEDLRNAGDFPYKVVKLCRG